MTLRNAHLADLPYLYEICHLTGYKGSDASSVVSDRTLLGQYFAAPYVVRDPHWCWVVADDAGPAGYLVATNDTRAFSRWMVEEWLPALRILSPRKTDPSWSEFETWLRGLFHGAPSSPSFVDDYPAHLHIDLVPRTQGQGWGRQLIEAFVGQLRSEGVRGFHLGVGAENAGARRFYRKMGFSLLKEESWGEFLGLSL